MAGMEVRVVTPDKVIYDGTAKTVVVRGMDGDFAIKKNHCPLIAPLGIGELKIVDENDKNKYVAVDGGIVEVSNNQVRVLSRDAILAEDIDIATVQMKLERSRREKDNLNGRVEQECQDREIYKLLSQLNVGQRKNG
ncbi:MAG: ATP synthase F1 subunit epsilon [Turicibacter sp.]|nr:ATP synthase F1 subunit epsilon [Turicibacter sp.]